MAVETWNVDNLEFTIERKPRQKNLYIKLRPETGAIHVSAPKNMAKTKIVDFIRIHAKTLKARQTQIKYKLLTAPKLVTGDIVPLWGEEKSLIVEDTNLKPAYSYDGQELTLKTSRNGIEDKKQLLRLWYKEELEDRLPKVTCACEAKTGLHATSYHVRHMKTRWGSCTHETGRIRLASKLAMYAEECLAYVVIHELIHLEEPNHGVGFYKRLEEVMPEWKKYRSMLREGRNISLD